MNRITFVSASAHQNNRKEKWYNRFMKKAESIISHLFDQPTFKNITRAKCLDLLLTHALPERLRKFIAFSYLRNDILFIAITHPGLKMELYYKRNLLKNVLTMLQKSSPKCEIIKFSDIRIFITKQAGKPTAEDTVPRYTEHASGEFENLARDESVQQKFETIREIICKNG